jgi:uncharacterized small protein (DUF1192 family)
VYRYSGALPCLQQKLNPLIQMEDFMDWDEPQAKAKPKPKDLSSLGVAELNDYITELKAEIARAEAEIIKRGKDKNAAEALFKS